MPSHRGPRFRRVARAFVLGVLALCLLLRPMLESMAEVHGLGHDDAPVLAHGAETHVPGSGDMVDHQGDGDRGDVLHALLHLAHCCGHSPATTPGAGVLVAAAPAADNVPTTTALAAPAPPATSLLRPPIAA